MRPGIASGFSEPSTFELRVLLALAMAARVQAGLTSRDMAFVDEPGKQLTVPLLSQHKDTAMLLLEQTAEKGAHAWDKDHVTLDPKDPADDMNCAQASVAMVNHFFGGDLSQDRLENELYKGRQPGPEEDLNHGYGFSPEDVTRLLTFALGAAPIRAEPGRTPDEVWADVTASIDAGWPVVAAGPTHVFVMTGYEITGGKRLISFNDPWNYPGRSGSLKYNIDANRGRSAAILDTWILPAGAAATAPGARGDQGHGRRWRLRLRRDRALPTVIWATRTLDGDKVADKEDIVSGVFDPRYGYAAHPNGPTLAATSMATASRRRSTRIRTPAAARTGARTRTSMATAIRARPGTSDAQDDKCFGWRGTMTGTYEWHLATSGTSGKGTATFAGLWEPIPADQPPASCHESTPGSCLGYYPTGTISWTWDAHRQGCDEMRSGQVPAGAINDPRNAGGANGVPLGTQVLVLVPDGAGKFGHLRCRHLDAARPDEVRRRLHSVRHPPAYFGLEQRERRATGHRTGPATAASTRCGRSIQRRPRSRAVL